MKTSIAFIYRPQIALAGLALGASRVLYTIPIIPVNIFIGVKSLVNELGLTPYVKRLRMPIGVIGVECEGPTMSLEDYELEIVEKITGSRVETLCRIPDTSLYSIKDSLSLIELKIPYYKAIAHIQVYDEFFGESNDLCYITFHENNPHTPLEKAIIIADEDKALIPIPQGLIMYVRRAKREEFVGSSKPAIVLGLPEDRYVVIEKSGGNSLRLRTSSSLMDTLRVIKGEQQIYEKPRCIDLIS